MRIRSLFFSGAAAAALLMTAPAFSGEAAANAEWRQVSYACESGTSLTVAFRATGSAVQVTAPDTKAVKLNSRPAKAGFRYADSRHELRGDGDAVTWAIGSRTPEKCVSDDPAAARLAEQVAAR